MAQLSYPFETQDTTESQYSRLFSELQITGVAGDIFNQSTGVRAAVGTGMNMEVYAGFALIRGFAYENTDTVILTLDPSTAQPRIDTIVLRLDPGANSIVAAVKKGTPAASPSAPALTQIAGGVWEMPLADMLIPANATALDNNNYTDRRTFLGKGVGVWFTSSRPTLPTQGQMGYNRTTQKFEWYNTATLTWSSAFPIDIDASAIADNSITDAKLVTKPGTYTSIRSEASSINLTSADVGRLIRYTGSVGVTVTLFGAAFTAGQRIDFLQDGTGQITFQAGASNTIASADNKLKTNKQYSGATLIYLGSNTWRLIGDLAA